MSALTQRLWNVGPRRLLGVPGVALVVALLAWRGGSGSDSKALRKLGTITSPSSFEFALGFSPGGSILASRGEAGRVTAWDVPRRKPLGVFQEEIDGLALTFSHDGRLFASTRLERATAFHTVVVRDVATGETVAECPVNQPSLLNLRFTPDDKELRFIAWDNLTRTPTAARFVFHVYDARTWAKVSAREVPAPWHSCAAASPDGSVIVTGVPQVPGAVLRDGSTGAEVAILDSPAAPPLSFGAGTYAFSGDGKTLAVGCDDGKVELWDVASRSLRARLGGQSEGFLPRSLAFASASPTLVVTGLLRDRSPSFGRTLIELPGRLIPALAARPQSYPSETVVWDVPKRRATLSLAGIWTAVLSPDGRTLATTRADSVITLWDVAPDAGR